MMGGVAEGGVRSISHMAMKQATPLLQSLEPQSMCATAINANVANGVNAKRATLVLLMLLLLSL